MKSFLITQQNKNNKNNMNQAKTLRDVVVTIIDYLQVGIYLIISLAVVTFIFNVYRYFFTEKEKKDAGMYVLYSTIGFFVILSFWGLVAILSNSLNLPKGNVSWPFNSTATNRSLNNGNPGFVVPSAENRAGFNTPSAENR